MRKRWLIGILICATLAIPPGPCVRAVASSPSEDAIIAVYEAEDAYLVSADVMQTLHTGETIESYSGDGFVGFFDPEDTTLSSVVFEVDVPEDGRYTLDFYTLSTGGTQSNIIMIDHEAFAYPALESYEDTAFRVYSLHVDLIAGQRLVRVVEGTGQLYLDALILRRQEAACIGAVTDPPVNPNASPEAIALKAYLNESYGKVVLSGQYADGINAPEVRAIRDITGKYPAMLGFDFLYYGKTAAANINVQPDATEQAIRWWQQGGIVTFCWHWLAPKDTLSAYPWNKTFQTDATHFDLGRALSGGDPEGYTLLLNDIDAVAAELAVLQKAGVPVLWRPLHEASGAWFWWGASGAEAYKALWQLMYDRLVNTHGLNNLIWVWSAQYTGGQPLGAWYPGDDTVDIIGEDIYAQKHEYTAHSSRFQMAQAYTADNKIIALTEVGVVPDPDILSADGSLWAWFSPWYREYVVDMSGDYEHAMYSGEFTDEEMLRKAYDHDLVITRDELPVFYERPSRVWIYVLAYVGVFALFYGRTIAQFVERRRKRPRHARR